MSSAEPQWSRRLTERDRKALTPLFWNHINPYGTFHLDMDRRLDLDHTPIDTEPAITITA